jgi:hypothetical protein
MQVLRSHCSTEPALSTSLEEKAYLRIACIARVRICLIIIIRLRLYQGDAYDVRVVVPTDDGERIVQVVSQRGESGKTNWTVTEPPKKKG